MPGPARAPFPPPALPRDGAAPAGREAAVTFLYRLVPGVAVSSFGLNVARMAGLPPQVLARAAAKAEEAEAAAKRGLSEAERQALSAALRRCGE